MEGFIFTVLLNVLKIDELGGSCSWYTKNAYKYSYENISILTKACGRPKHRFEDNIKMIPNETEY